MSTDVPSLPRSFGPQLIWPFCRYLQLNRSPPELISSSVHFPKSPFPVHGQTTLAIAIETSFQSLSTLTFYDQSILFFLNCLSKHPFFCLHCHSPVLEYYHPMYSLLNYTLNQISLPPIHFPSYCHNALSKN